MSDEPASSIVRRAAEIASLWIATGLGLGLVAPAPGTTAGAWGLLLLPPFAALADPLHRILVAAALAAVAAAICELARGKLGGDSDPHPIVLDEIVALPIVFCFAANLTFPLVAAGYLLFRVFDVLKPWPIRWFEQLPGGVGIVADDLAAAAAACAALNATQWIAAAAGWNLFAA